MNTVMKNRVPHIIFLYWVIKIASTTLGETGADMFSMTFNFGYGITIALFMCLFFMFLLIKLYLKKYCPTVYWLTFTATAIVGTAISDFINRTLGLGYAWGSIILIILLFAILVVWYIKEKSINVEYITKPSVEICYWIAFLIANTLGTAAGDFLADDLGFGFMNSTILISGILGVIVLCHYYTKINGTLLFWLAFILTRPFGATFGDFLTKPADQGGMNLGTIGSSLFFCIILIFAIVKEIRFEKQKVLGV